VLLKTLRAKWDIVVLDVPASLAADRGEFRFVHKVAGSPHTLFDISPAVSYTLPDLLSSTPEYLSLPFRLTVKALFGSIKLDWEVLALTRKDELLCLAKLCLEAVSKKTLQLSKCSAEIHC